jgi:hypothetical protein
MKTFTKLFVILALATFLSACNKQSSDDSAVNKAESSSEKVIASEPASLVQAASVLNPANFELIHGAEEPSHKNFFTKCWLVFIW